MLESCIPRKFEPSRTECLTEPVGPMWDAEIRKGCKPEQSGNHELRKEDSKFKEKSKAVQFGLASAS